MEESKLGFVVPAELCAHTKFRPTVVLQDPSSWGWVLASEGCCGQLLLFWMGGASVNPAGWCRRGQLMTLGRTAWAVRLCLVPAGEHSSSPRPTSSFGTGTGKPSVPGHCPFVHSSSLGYF